MEELNVDLSYVLATCCSIKLDSLWFHVVNTQFTSSEIVQFTCSKPIECLLQLTIPYDRVTDIKLILSNEALSLWPKRVLVEYTN